jgi:hypothetical protein
MKINKGYIIVGLIIAFGLIFELAAHADERDEATTITFTQPIQVPGQILPAGTYVFKLANADVGLDTVQIFNADRTVLYATLPTIPTDRVEPTARTTIALVEQGAGQPAALVKWFYPGSDTGHEFVYSAKRKRN